MSAQRCRSASTAIFALASFATAQGPDFAKVQIATEKLAEGVYMLKGAGGNVGVSAGADGVFLVDDEYAPLTPKVEAAIAAVSDKPIRFVFNTHWHPDHTGGNENLGKAGVLIVAHDNVRTRMTVEEFIKALGMKVPPSPKAALPVVTFNDAVTFHLNGDEIHAFHVPPAHTDGDSIVHFRKANVVHMGDLYFNGMYPFIDLGTGGSVDGMIGAADHALSLVDANTRIIPGHGAVSGRGELAAFRDMLVMARDRIKPMAASGKRLEQVIAAKPTRDLDEKWGKGFLKPEAFVEIVYTDFANRVGPRRSKR